VDGLAWNGQAESGPLRAHNLRCDVLSQAVIYWMHKANVVVLYDWSVESDPHAPDTSALYLMQVIILFLLPQVMIFFDLPLLWFLSILEMVTLFPSSL